MNKLYAALSALVLAGCATAALEIEEDPPQEPVAESFRAPGGPWDLLWIHYQDEVLPLAAVELLGQELAVEQVYRTGDWVGYRLAGGDWEEGPYTVEGAPLEAGVVPVFHVEQWAESPAPTGPVAYSVADPELMMPFPLDVAQLLDLPGFELQLDPLGGDQVALSFVAVDDAGQACLAYQEQTELDPLARVRVERDQLSSPLSGDRPGLIYDLGLYFGRDGDLAGGLHAEGLVDLAPWVPMVESAEDVDDLCSIVRAVGSECEPCPDGEQSCLQLVVDSTVMLPVSPREVDQLDWCAPPDGPLVPDIQFDFDCGCATGSAGWAWLGVVPLVALRRKRKEK